jgi:hypothetical protein
MMGTATLMETVQAKRGNHAYVEAEGTENLHFHHVKVGVVGWVRIINEN